MKLPRRPLIALVLAIVAYVVAAWSVAPGFFDGFAPPAPYRWVSPPPQFKQGNQAPMSGQGQAIITPQGSVALENGSLSTNDNQAAISFIPGSIVTPASKQPVAITIQPVASYPNPGGVRLATNVYCYTSSSPVAAGHDVLITLTFSTGITAPSDIYSYQPPNGSWQRLGSTGTAAPYSISAQARSMGCFAAGSQGQSSGSAGSSAGGGGTVPLILVGIILFVLLAAIPLVLLRLRQ
jgi:hypothetical protein